MVASDTKDKAPQAGADGHVTPGGGPPTAQAIETWLVSYLAERLGIAAAKISPDVRFDRLGVDSLGAVVMTEDLQGWLGLAIDPTTPFDHPTITDLAAHLAGAAAAARGA
jgi:acyl carrier protein